jgi:elongation factor Ts
VGEDAEKLKTAKLPSGATVTDELTRLVATIGENMSLRRAARLTVANGVVATYVHNQIAAGMGKIGVLVALESTGDAAKLTALGKQIAMHVAAAQPLALDIGSVDPKALEREREVLREQARASGKPDNVVEKMIEGRLRKYYEETVLLEQVYVIDAETKIKDVVGKAAKEIGAPIALTGFARFQLGEGIERETTDFAAEVAATAGR